MKLFGFNIGGSKNTPELITTDTGYQTFSTPFGQVGNGDLSKPYVNSNYTGAGGYVRFGTDNLYPQLINQMYYTSPINSSLIDLKVNAIIGGGWEIVGKNKSGVEKVDEYTFIRTNKLKQVINHITQNYVMHNTVYALIHFDDKMEPKRFELIQPEKVRRNKSGDKFFISDDWSRSLVTATYSRYDLTCKDKKQVLVLEKHGPGQDIYPLPSYTNAFNWCFLDGEMSYLHKSNILNSIFPSFALMLPKVPNSKDESDEIKRTVEKAKGASNAGKALIFAANGKEYLPEIQAIPTNTNDKLFLETDERIDLKISQAHQVDPLIAGVRTSGKLGSGTDIQIAYQIFEKNFVKPYREDIKDFMEELMLIFNISGDFEIKDYQIIDLEIKQQ